METLKGICFFVFFYWSYIVISAMFSEKITYMLYCKKGVQITGKIVDMDHDGENSRKINVTVVEYHVGDKTRLLLLYSEHGDEIGKEISVYKYGDYIVRSPKVKFNLGILPPAAVILTTLIYIILHWNGKEDGIFFLFGTVFLILGVLSNTWTNPEHLKALKKKLGWHDNL